MRKIFLLFVVIILFLSIFAYQKNINKDVVSKENKISYEKEKDYLLYKNISRGFTIEYPRELFYKEIDEGDTTFTIVFSDDLRDKGFQIFFTPYYGDQITSSRILKDVPSGKYSEPIEIIINGSIRAITFISTLDVGEMREVWFLHDGYLYQVTAPKDLDEWLAKIVETWEFYQIEPVGSR